MIKKDLRKLKSLLEKDKKRIEKQIKGLGKVDFGDDINADEDAADEVEERISNQAISSILIKRFKEIDKALEKIGAGTYGICEKCKKEISTVLLLVDPESKLCQNCKIKHG